MINPLTRWEPVGDLEVLQNRLSSLFGRAPARRGNGREELAMADWAPLADITEDDKEYVIKTELPDVNKDDVKVTVENGVLTISGERKFEKEEKNKRYHRIERAYGTFVRSFSLPDDADSNGVKAEFKDGILTVHLPKNESAKPRQIEVKVSSGDQKSGQLGSGQPSFGEQKQDASKTQTTSQAQTNQPSPAK
jgi:HSP20 family protein